MDLTGWSLPSDAATGLRLGGGVAHLVFTVTGAAHGTPRTVSSWSDGTSWRAESDTGALWVDGPGGTYWRAAGDPDVSAASAGSAPLFRHPLPEVDALMSARDAALWLGKAPPTVAGTGVHATTGRFVTEHTGAGLSVVVDDETGLVFDVTADMPRGRMELRTQSLTIQAAAGNLFGPVAGAVPWSEFSHDWQAAD